MSEALATELEEMAARLLSAANRLRGIDTPPDAARMEPKRQTCCGICGESMIPGPDGKWWHGDSPDCQVAVDAARYVPPGEEPEMIPVQVMTGLSFGVYVHRDPIRPLQIGDCPWPSGQCTGHRVGLGGMPLLTVPDDQAVYVSHRHAPNSHHPCHEIVCHETHGRPCRYCGGAPCRITPLEREA